MDRARLATGVRIGRGVRVLNSDFERLVSGRTANDEPSPQAAAFWDGTETHADPMAR